MTRSFSQNEARKILDAPDTETLMGLRDRAILSLGFQSGLRRSEIVKLKVGDYFINAGYPSIRVRRKGGKKGDMALNPNTAQRIETYMEKAGNKEDKESALFLAVKGKKGQDDRRHLDSKRVEAILFRYCKQVGIPTSGYSAHSMRATFITRALDNGAPLEDVQAAAGHVDPSTTKLYDRRGYNPERSASFFANY